MNEVKSNNSYLYYVEFDRIKSVVGLDSFRLTAKEWQEANQAKKENIINYRNMKSLRFVYPYVQNVTFLINQIERDDGKKKQRLASAAA